MEIFRVGDEVITNSKDRGIVIYVGQSERDEISIVVMSYIGAPYGGNSPDMWHKTGRHFPQIAEVLAELKKSHDEDWKEWR